jgi:hypothetical protein
MSTFVKKSLPFSASDRNLYAFLISPMRATAVSFIPLHFITLYIFEDKLAYDLTELLVMQFTQPSYFRNILFSTLFSDISNLCALLKSDRLGFTPIQNTR